MDFDNLVLSPCMDAFSETILIDPLNSQPGQLPYQARAVFTSRPYEQQLDDGSVVADQQTTIEFRLSEFTAPPTARDLITIRGQQYIGTDFHNDGQGGATLSLHKTKPAGTTTLPAPYQWPAAAGLAGSGGMVHAVPVIITTGAVLAGAGGVAVGI